ncbi:MAG: pyridoxal-phosphate-dependent aminotransferase family protein [Persicimonas sp.]
MDRQFLMAPGPTPVPEEARLAMARRLIHHRGEAFREVFGEVQEGLAWLFETDQPVLSVAATGTGAFEAAMINFTSRGDTIVCVGGGKFGRRWADVGRAYDMEVVEVPVEWGRAVDPDRIEEALNAHPDCAMVTLTASETSTGVLHPFEEIAEVVRDHGRALFAVDGITAVGVHRMPMDETPIDILVAGSQKAFGVPPGLGFVAASERAWKRAERSDHPRYYLDLRRERRRQRDQQTAFTSAISQTLALQVVLRMMADEGREALLARHRVNAEATRAGVRALGLELLADRPSNAVTAVEPPDGVAAPRIVDIMREEHGVIIAGGQADLSERLFRIGHIGFFDRSDMLNALSALELTLQRLGIEVESGAAVSAAQGVYAAHLE